MAVKHASPPFQLCASVSMSGTTAYTSSVTSIIYRDSISYQAAWTGIPTGTFDVQGSIDYNPGLPESAGPTNAGTWDSIPLTPSPAATGSGGANHVLMNLNQLGFAYTKVVYTNSTGSGVMALWTSAKSLG